MRSGAWCVCVEGDEGTAYIRDPDWLKDLETAAAIAKLHDAVQVSTEDDDAGRSDFLLYRWQQQTRAKLHMTKCCRKNTEASINAFYIKYAHVRSKHLLMAAIVVIQIRNRKRIFALAAARLTMTSNECHQLSWMSDWSRQRRISWWMNDWSEDYAELLMDVV